MAMELWRGATRNYVFTAFLPGNRSSVGWRIFSHLGRHHSKRAPLIPIEAARFKKNGAAARLHRFFLCMCALWLVLAQVAFGAPCQVQPQRAQPHTDLQKERPMQDKGRDPMPMARRNGHKGPEVCVKRRQPHHAAPDAIRRRVRHKMGKVTTATTDQKTGTWTQ